MHRNMELRKVPEGYLDIIADILHINDDWKRVMALIPKDIQNINSSQKYNIEHQRLIEQHARLTNSKCAKILFDEWGTSGRIRPTVQTLMDILQKAQIIRAAEELATMLQEDVPPRPTAGPAAPIDIDVSSLLNSDSQSQINCNGGGSNGSYGSNIHNRPTKPMTTNNTKLSMAGGHSSTALVKNSNKVNNNIEAPPATDMDSYQPAFSELNPKTVEIGNNTNSTMSSGSTFNTDTSESASEEISHSENSEISYFPIPPSSLIVQLDCEILEDPNLIIFKYSELQSITGNFSNSHIGSGGFGDVFVGIHAKYGKIAIKRAHSMLMNTNSLDFEKIFNSEVKSLTILRHENIVPILGYCSDVSPCIVCEYIDGGSLLENIADKRLNKNQRMNIIVGTAKGLKYIHNTVKPPSLGSNVGVINSAQKRAYFLHGDVKSANILISKDFIPKLCDFGLSKECMTTNHHTESIMGTRAYMAPERFTGTVTQKGDVFSFGIVILELLTGLQPIVNDNNENINIKEYVEENSINDNITNLLDPVVGPWPKAQRIYELAQKCMISNKNKRPSINEVCDSLHEIVTE